MASFNVSDILSATAGVLIAGDAQGVFRGVTTNSRQVKKGDLFIAIVGDKHDAHKFIPEVIKKKAAGLVVSQDISNCPPSVVVIKVKDTTKALGHIARCHRLRFSLPVIAITGSAGKTTTKEMIALLLANKYKVLKNVGTENNQFGVPLTILKLKASDEIAVLEVGTNCPGDIAWLASIVCPTVVVVTNIGESHLALLKTADDVFKEKFNLVKALDDNGTVIFNNDDLFLRKIPVLRRNIAVSNFGIVSKAKLQAQQVVFAGKNVSFSLAGAGKFLIPGTATANVYNALAAITCARLFRVSGNDMKRTLKKFSLKSGRQTLIRTKKVAIINDSYNANPVSFRSALEAITHFETAGRKILICGDMLELGTQAERLHREIGERAAASGLSAVISFGNFSRLIGIQARKQNAGIDIFHSSKIAAVETQIKKYLCPTDLVLIKGSRGMHMERFVDFIEKLTK